MRRNCRFFRLVGLVIFLFTVVNSPAEDEKKGLFGIRFSSKKPEPSKEKEAPPATPLVDGKRISNDPGIKLGLTSGTVQIPPELKKLAQDGANAIAKGEWSKAREMYLEMVLQAPDNPLSYANLGVAEYQLKNYLAAEGNLKKSLDLNPSIAQNWTTLGLIQFERRELLLAISSLTRAIHEDPKSAQAHLYLAAVTYDYGWTMAAIDELNKVIELEPDHAQAHYNLALTYLGLNPPKLELARRHYEEAKDLGAPPSPKIEEILRISPK